MMTKQYAENDRVRGPLFGLRVLDLSRVLAGPWASQILGDLGAEVIKVEQPLRGDDTRSWGPPFIDNVAGGRDAAYFTCCNRNKHSVAIDFSQPAGANLIRRIAAMSDVVIENFRPGVLKKVQLDHATLLSSDPRLVYCSITGFGHTGPYADRGGYDFLIQALSGLMSITGRQPDEPGAGPMKVGIPVSDLLSGLYATVSILAALYHRRRTGEGQHIDCALLDCQIASLSNQAANYLVGGTVPAPLGNSHPNVVPYRDFVAGGRHVIVACGNDRQFVAFCQLLRRDDLTTDPRYQTNANRSANRHELERELAREIAGWQAADLVRAMEAAGVPGGYINRIDEALKGVQVESRQLLQTMKTKHGQEIPIVGFPVRLARTPASYRLAPPRLGEDTQSVLIGRLGLDEEEIARLRASGVVQLA